MCIHLLPLTREQYFLSKKGGTRSIQGSKVILLYLLATVSFTGSSTVAVRAGGLRVQIRVVRKVDAGFCDPPLDLVLRLLEHSCLKRI